MTHPNRVALITGCGKPIGIAALGNDLLGDGALAVQCVSGDDGAL